ncbi:MAG: methylamine utilization protein [Deltaproteobacteria bacterium]|nr:methylamine utilization protein [Deltaproteobacteria bacterium]
MIGRRQVTGLLLATAMALGASAHAAGDGAIVKGTVTLPEQGGSPQDVVVSLEGSAGTPAPAKAVIDQKDMKFVPHVVAVVAGSTVEFLNSDAFLHNVFSTSAAKHFDLGMFGRGESRSVTFETPGVVDVKCNVHPHMEAFVVVLANPYFAQPDSQGKFQISGIPPGRYKLRAWHESLKAVETWVNLDPAKLQTVDLRFKK